MKLKNLFPNRLAQKRRAKSQRPAEPQLIELLEQRSLLAAANPLISIGDVAPTILPGVNGKQLLALVHGNATHLYTTNGTQAGTVEFVDMAAALTIPANGVFSDYAILGTEMYFSAVGAGGQELWKTNGTAAGTQLVFDINTGTADSSPAGFSTFNGFVYFAATTTISGRELWRTNGTAIGTTLVTDVVLGTSSSNPARLLSFDNQLFFATLADNDVYRTDGTGAGTFLVASGNFSDSRFPDIGTFPVAVVNGRLIIKREETSLGVDLLALSSSTAVPEVIKHFDLFNESGARQVLDGFTVADSELFFRAEIYVYVAVEPRFNITRGNLWQSDGFAAGTVIASNRTLFWTSSFTTQIVPFPHGVFVDGASEKLVFRDAGMRAASFSADGSSFAEIPATNTVVGNFVQFGTELFGLQADGLVRFDSTLTTVTPIRSFDLLLDGQAGNLRVMLGGLWFATPRALWKYDVAAPHTAGPVITSPGAYVGPAAGQTVPSTITIDWDPVASASFYECEVSWPGGSTGYVQVTASQLSIGFNGIGAYTARVRAVLANGQLTEVTVKSFTVVAAPQNLTVSELVLEEKLLLSINDSTFPEYAYVFVLDRFTGETVLSTFVVFPTGTSRSVAVSLPKSKLPGHHSLIVKVTTVQDVAAPGTSINVDVYYTAVSVSFSGANTTLTWPAPAGATAYDLWIDDDVNKVSQYVRNRDLVTNSYTGTFPSSTYRVWVRAKLANGFLTNWSSPAGFTTGGTMRLVNPTANFTDGKGDEAFVWSKVKNATGYELWVTNTITNTRIIHQPNLASSVTTYLADFDLGPASYAVWVRPKFVGNTFGAWSPVRNFTIQPNRPITVTGGLGPVFDTTPTITWQAASYATSYEIWISRKGEPAAIYRRVNLPAASTSHTVDTALPVGEYDLWVRAYGPNGIASPWGTANRLSVGFGTVNSQPYISAPRTLSWAAIPGATRYDLWVDYLCSSQPAENQIVRVTTLTETTYVLPAALPSGNYRAWVRGFRTENGVTFTSIWSVYPGNFTLG